jgi:hypothetical protein
MLGSNLPFLLRDIDGSNSSVRFTRDETDCILRNYLDVDDVNCVDFLDFMHWWCDPTDIVPPELLQTEKASESTPTTPTLQGPSKPVGDTVAQPATSDSKVHNDDEETDENGSGRASGSPSASSDDYGSMVDSVATNSIVGVKNATVAATALGEEEHSAYHEPVQPTSIYFLEISSSEENSLVGGVEDLQDQHGELLQVAAISFDDLPSEPAELEAVVDEPPAKMPFVVPRLHPREVMASIVTSYEVGMEKSGDGATAATKRKKTVRLQVEVTESTDAMDLQDNSKKQAEDETEAYLATIPFIAQNDNSLDEDDGSPVKRKIMPGKRKSSHRLRSMHESMFEIEEDDDSDEDTDDDGDEEFEGNDRVLSSGRRGNAGGAMHESMFEIVDKQFNDDEEEGDDEYNGNEYMSTADASDAGHRLLNSSENVTRSLATVNSTESVKEQQANISSVESNPTRTSNHPVEEARDNNASSSTETSGSMVGDAPDSRHTRRLSGKIGRQRDDQVATLVAATMPDATNMSEPESAESAAQECSKNHDSLAGSSSTDVPPSRVVPISEEDASETAASQQVQREFESLAPAPSSSSRRPQLHRNATVTTTTSENETPGTEESSSKPAAASKLSSSPRSDLPRANAGSRDIFTASSVVSNISASSSHPAGLVDAVGTDIGSGRSRRSSGKNVERPEERQEPIIAPGTDKVISVTGAYETVKPTTPELESNCTSRTGSNNSSACASPDLPKDSSGKQALRHSMKIKKPFRHDISKHHHHAYQLSTPPPLDLGDAGGIIGSSSDSSRAGSQPIEAGIAGIQNLIALADRLIKAQDSSASASAVGDANLPVPPSIQSQSQALADLINKNINAISPRAESRKQSPRLAIVRGEPDAAASAVEEAVGQEQQAEDHPEYEGSQEYQAYDEHTNEYGPHESTGYNNQEGYEGYEGYQGFEGYEYPSGDQYEHADQTSDQYQYAYAYGADPAPQDDSYQYDYDYQYNDAGAGHDHADAESSVQPEPSADDAYASYLAEINARSSLSSAAVFPQYIPYDDVESLGGVSGSFYSEQNIPTAREVTEEEEEEIDIDGDAQSAEFTAGEPGLIDYYEEEEEEEEEEEDGDGSFNTSGTSGTASLSTDQQSTGVSITHYTYSASGQQYL